MINRTIFKQTLKSNYLIWVIFTLVLCLLNVVLIAVFDPKTITSMTDLVKNTPLSNLLTSATFLGMLAQTFYSLHGVILPLVYIIITANSLIASQVDRGSMVYLLSAPIKRSVVVRTQAAYFIMAMAVMFVIVTVAGLFAIQTFHGGVWGKGYPADVQAASSILNMSDDEIDADRSLILKNSEALKAGAEARGLDEEVYPIYLNLKITEKAFTAAAEKLNIDVEEVKNDPSLIKNNDAALKAAAEAMHQDQASYRITLDQLIASKAMLASQAAQMQDQLAKGLTAAADILDVKESDLAADMGKIKENDAALSAAIDASGIPKVAFLALINQQLAANAVAADQGIDFKGPDYLWLNLGLFLLMFATSGISFMFSCIFNLSKNYMAFGAGIPLAFFILKMMGQTSDNLEIFKYLSLNSLYDTSEILNGGNYYPQFVVLAVVGMVLYVIGMRVFVAKDLPL